MRQVPSYTVVGSGRLAKHIVHYLHLLEIPTQSWTRHEDINTLYELSKNSSHVIIAISDDALNGFCSVVKDKLHAPHVFHCSGSVHVPGVPAIHPLMTFSDQLYSLETYQQIPWVRVDNDIPLPGLPNKTYFITQEKQQKYHALCVMGGNFMQLLWAKVISDFQNELDLPKEALELFAQKSLQNIFENADALTGPLVRNDSQTINNHLEALKSDSWLGVYRSFIEVFERDSA